MAFSVPEKAIGKGYDLINFPLPFADETRSWTERAGSGGVRAIALPGVLAGSHPFPGSFTRSCSKTLFAAAGQSAMAVNLDAIGKRANKELARHALGGWLPVQTSPEVMDRIAAKVRKIGNPDLVEGCDG